MARGVNDIRVEEITVAPPGPREVRLKVPQLQKWRFLGMKHGWIFSTFLGSNMFGGLVHLIFLVENKRGKHMYS